MMLKITSWNIKWFGQLLQGKTRTIPRSSRLVETTAGKALQRLQKEKIAEQIGFMDPDILCIQEGPSVGNVARLEAFCEDFLDDQWRVVKRPANERYGIRGSQGIFFLVRSGLWDELEPRLLPNAAWVEATELESRVDRRLEGSGEHQGAWPIIHPLFKAPDEDVEDVLEDGAESEPPLDDDEHRHYRHPQVLVCTFKGRRFDVVGVHLKSKFGGELYEKAGKARAKARKSAAERKLIREVEQISVSNRIKISTEATNVRYYIENRFHNEPNPAIFLAGDLNDGIGKEVFERKYVFHDLISNLQGDVFVANRFLNHALFDYSSTGAENHRWTARFKDVWDPHRPEEVLLDHIMFTQGLVGDNALEDTGMRVRAGAGKVEHKIHNAANAMFNQESDFTSDHRPVSVTVHTQP